MRHFFQSLDSFFVYFVAFCSKTLLFSACFEVQTLFGRGLNSNVIPDFRMPVDHVHPGAPSKSSKANKLKGVCHVNNLSDVSLRSCSIMSIVQVWTAELKRFKKIVDS